MTVPVLATQPASQLSCRNSQLLVRPLCHPRPHARLRLNAHKTVMLAADPPPQRADSFSSVESAVSNPSLSEQPRTTKLRSRSRSVAPDTRRNLSTADDANGSMSDELFASYSSRSAGHSPVNSPGWNSSPHTQSSSPFPFSTPTHRRPSSAEPTVPQLDPQPLRGRHQIPGPSKVSN